MITDCVRYPGKEMDLRAFVARPDVAYTSPGIVLLHDRWGLTPEVEELAQRLALDGYVTMVPDLFRGVVPRTAERARRLVREFDEAQGVEDVRLALAWLRNQGYVKGHQVGVVGLCLGGRFALLSSTLTPNPPQVVIVYYAPVAGLADRMNGMAVPVQGHFGGKDNMVPAKDVRALAEFLDRARVPHEVYTYPRAGHDFIRPGSKSYNAAVARQAWERMVAFLEKYLHVRGGES